MHYWQPLVNKKVALKATFFLTIELQWWQQGCMTLNEYKVASGMTQQALADLLGYNKGHISRILSGKSSVSPKRAREIAEKLTGVTVHDLRPDIFPPPPQKRRKA